MSIRHGLLALLARGPRYGYQLRAEFESLTGATWPLNVGQVYSTLSRLERDGLAVRVGADDEGRFVYRITATGLAEVERWYGSPVGHAGRSRDELAIKLALAVTSPGVDVRAVLQAQRTATLLALRDLDRQRVAARQADRSDGHDAAWLLVLESMVLQTEAELRWLDHCEEYMLSAAPATP
jgi:DNA-binding PadR family transcriptional regulator